MEALKQMIEVLREVNSEKFIMNNFNTGTHNQTPLEELHYCGTGGCIVGHCVKLDISLFDVFYRMWVEETNKGNHSAVGFVYVGWSQQFTGLTGIEWHWCFNGSWAWLDKGGYNIGNTIDHAIGRLQAMIDGTWKEHPNYDYFTEYIAKWVKQ